MSRNCINLTPNNKNNNNDDYYDKDQLKDHCKCDIYTDDLWRIFPGFKWKTIDMQLKEMRILIIIRNTKAVG